MKRFFGNLAFFLAIQLGPLALLWWNCDLDAEANYLAATVDKHRRLDQVGRPRMILVGGSNIALGLRSEELENAFGRPVVNMGLAVALGLEFMLNEVEDSVGSGDVIVLSPEYEVLSGNYNPLTLQQIVTYRPQSLVRLSYFQLGQLAIDHGLGTLCEWVRRAVYIDRQASQKFAETQFPYTRSGFNGWGDFVAHHGLASTNLPAATVRLVGEVEPQVNVSFLPNRAILRRLEAFAAHCRARGAKLFYSFPPRPIEEWIEEKATVELIFKQLRDIPGLVMLDEPKDHVYARGLFYDSRDHLVAEGATERTQRLIRALRERW